MEKKFNARDVSMIKRIYQNVDASWQKSLKLKEQIKKKVAELEELNKDIEEMEAPVIRRTGGYKSTELVEKKIVPTYNEDGSEKLDKDGRPIKVTKFVLKYGDNVIPLDGTEGSHIPTPEVPGCEENQEAVLSGDIDNGSYSASCEHIN